MAKRVLMGIQELRLHLKERVDALNQGVHTVFARHGKPVAVLVDMAWYRRAAEALGEPTEYGADPPARISGNADEPDPS